MDTSKILIEAIALRRCVEATYNRSRFILAPHALYTRHDELFVDAITIRRNAQQPREFKFGIFKLAGLTDLELSIERFHPEPTFNPIDSRYENTLLFAVEPV